MFYGTGYGIGKEDGDALAQDSSNSIANALELLRSCTKASRLSSQPCDVKPSVN